jgi:ribosome maturation factor RimP
MVRCFLTIFLHAEDRANALEQKQRTATEVLSKLGYKIEGAKMGRGRRRVTIYTTIKSKGSETAQQEIDRVSQIVSQAINRKTVGRPLMT